MAKLNLYDFDRLYRRTVLEEAGATSPHRLKLDRVDPRRVRVLTHVTVEDETTAYTKCRLGIETLGKDHYLDELQTVAADELAVSRSDIILGEGDVLFAELTGATENDVLVLTAAGWEQDL